MNYVGNLLCKSNHNEYKMGSFWPYAYWRSIQISGYVNKHKLYIYINSSKPITIIQKAKVIKENGGDLDFVVVF